MSMHFICTSLHFSRSSHSLWRHQLHCENSHIHSLFTSTYINLQLHFTYTTALHTLAASEYLLYFISSTVLLPGRLTCVCSVNVASEIDCQTIICFHNLFHSVFLFTLVCHAVSCEHHLC